MTMVEGVVGSVSGRAASTFARASAIRTLASGDRSPEDVALLGFGSRVDSLLKDSSGARARGLRGEIKAF